MAENKRGSSMDTEMERDKVKSSKPPFDASKLTPPQREALAIARAQGVPFNRHLEDLIPDLGLTAEEADAFGKTLQLVRDDGNRQKRKDPSE